VACYRQMMSDSKPGGTGADHGNTPAGFRPANEQRFTGVSKKMIGGVALEQADIERATILSVTYAACSQGFGRADAATDPA
jgi:hypothetical protein